MGEVKRECEKSATCDHTEKNFFFEFQITRETTCWDDAVIDTNTIIKRRVRITREQMANIITFYREMGGV